MEKITLKTATLFLSIILLLTVVGCGAKEQTKETTSAKETTTQAQKSVEDYINSDHGSAVTLEGKTVLVSIFTNDNVCRWDDTAEEDRQTMEDTRQNLAIATAYLTRQVKRYQKQLSFVYDWKKHEDLIYYADFESVLVRTDGTQYTAQDAWLKENIDTPALLEKYQADNMIFLFFFNTDESNTVNPWSLGHANGDYILLEYSNFYLRYDGFIMPPSSYAHELMHAFGAHDYYYANAFVPQKYVEHLQQIESEDIMFTIAKTPEITNDFTDLDAYFTGIAPRPAEADRWDIAKSEHDVA